MNRSLSAGPVTLEQATAIAGRLFDQAADVRHLDAVSVGAWCLWHPIRGGGQVLVDVMDATFLYGGSAVTSDDLFAAFAAGTRTDPAELADTDRPAAAVRCRYGTGRDETWSSDWDTDGPVLMCETHGHPAGGMAYLGATDDPCRSWEGAYLEYRNLFPPEAEVRERLGDPEWKP